MVPVSARHPARMTFDWEKEKLVEEEVEDELLPLDEEPVVVGGLCFTT